ncbi:DEAD/DEAH box helicase [Microseira sp. BLCC-F43]|jgi:hypothetical protein|uniref:DEAD/DEAH box helicase n=1 Tax=Microseira sp. BLCC-F43 TaxID=3153602 RepID=UPI0035BB735C
MALIVPDSLPSGASQGEKTLYKILAEKLSNEFYVWYEPNAQGCLPYFTILAPKFGLLFIKVVNWFPNQISSGDRDNFTIKSGSEEINRIDVQPTSPESQVRRTRKRSRHENETKNAKINVLHSSLKQVDNYLNKFLNKLQHYPILTQPNGSAQVRLAFPVGIGLVMSNITVNQARDPNISQLLIDEKVIYRNELLSWDNISEIDLVNQLEMMFPDKLPFLNLTPDQIETIKGILYPEIAIKEVPASSNSVPDNIELRDNSYVIRTLDHRQECIVKSIGGGHRIIYGVAGSGKTLVLLSRAKLLANRNPNQRILILCFNIGLASYFQSLLPKKIDVMHFDAWVKHLLGREYKTVSHLVNYREYVVEIALNKLNQLPIGLKWDAILVDEAQAFYPYWFKCCVAALKDPENGDLTIVSDGKQSFYSRPRFSWKSVGVKAVGRTTSKKFHLDINYRNTKEILEAAWSLVKNTHEVENIINTGNTDDSEVTFPIIEPQASIRQGERPVLHIVNTKQQEVESVIRQIQKLHKLGYELREIAVLHRLEAVLNHDRSMLYYLRKRLNNLGLDTYWVTETLRLEKITYSVNIPGIRIMTTHTSLGLEFKAVLILWVQEYDNNRAINSEIAALDLKKLYVAMTRAQDVLHVFGSGDSRLIEQLKQSGNFAIQYD